MQSIRQDAENEREDIKNGKQRDTMCRPKRTVDRKRAIKREVQHRLDHNLVTDSKIIVNIVKNSLK